MNYIYQKLAIAAASTVKTASISIKNSAVSGNTRKSMKKIFLTLGLTAGLFLAEKATAYTITDTVPGTHSLYYSDWGHPYNISGGGHEMYALNRGEAAVSFGDGFAFSSGQNISINASGCVVDAGVICTEPDGYGFGELFRGLPVYSLIGVWSSDPEAIHPVEVGSNPAFFIGSSLNSIVPKYTSDLYLFLGDNDGTFEDNPSSFAYTVTINSPEPKSVPEPGNAAGLIGLSLVGLGMGVQKKLAEK